MARWTPCDDGICPFGAENAVGGYFCRDNCGLGVDDGPDEQYVIDIILDDEDVD